VQASESGHKDDFFVSYSKPDRAWAEWIAWQLEDAGYTTILQAWDFRAGSNWALNMRKATQQSERMIAVLSPDYLKSENAQAEWASAFAADPSGRERKIIPIRVRPVDLAGLDSTIVYIDLVDKDEQTARTILHNELREGRLKPAHAPAFPSKTTNASREDASAAQSSKPQFPSQNRSNGFEVLRTWFIQHRLAALVASGAGVIAVAALIFALRNQAGTHEQILNTFQNERSHAKSSQSASGEPIVGITLWKMRQATTSDSATVRFRGLIHPEDPDDNAEWIAERVSLESPIPAGQNVRLSIESARPGYLYVIDRDVYADGSSSLPSLVFPTFRLHGGDNRVQPGVTIEIPDAQDRPPALQLKKTRADQVSVLLTIIVAPQAIREIRTGRGRQQLTREQVAEWEKNWGTKTVHVENSASVGKAYTASEQASAQSDSHPLGPDDPLPMTLIKSTAGSGEPMLVSVSIKLQ
jgi:TIR domain